MISAVFTVLFGLSLLPGRKPLCLRFAERISGGIMPDGAEAYCKRLTWVWFVLLLISTSLVFVGIWWVSMVIVPMVFAVELPIRRRRFKIVFHTSGSTGKSKTIVKSFETLAREVAMHRDELRRRFGVDGWEQVMFLGTVDTGHMLGKLWLDMLPDALGARSDKSITYAPEELVAKMNAAEKVFLVTTPSFLERFVRYADQYAIPKNTIEIITSGAALSLAVSKRTREVFGVEPKQIFGSTETGGVAWMRGEMKPKVFEFVKVKEVRVDGEEIARLGVKSPFSFKRGWYVMGDGVKIDSDGRGFVLLGRQDRLVKINEERVNLAEMEDKVRATGYQDCACVALEGEHGPYLALVLVGEKEDTLVVRRRLAEVFPKGTLPKKFRFVNELPRNTQGKVLKSAIAEMF